jgi:hypothetical protein
MAYYGDDFLRDLEQAEPAPFGAVRAQDGRRIDSHHQTAADLREAVHEGSVCAVKLSRHWGGTMPDAWKPMRELYARLYEAVGMLYLTPKTSEDVDLFFAGADSCLGTHFDTTDVFTLQLSGERRWLVEEVHDLTSILDVGRDPHWYPTREIAFPGPPREIVLRPGDALYLPAYTIHRVQGGSRESVSLSLGLRAYNEIDIVEHLLAGLRRTEYLRHPPFPGIPPSLPDAHADARLDLLERVRSLLGDLDAMALGYLLSPMRLPPHLQDQADSAGPDPAGG